MRRTHGAAPSMCKAILQRAAQQLQAAQAAQQRGAQPPGCLDSARRTSSIQPLHTPYFTPIPDTPACMIKIKYI
eukprot:scaffold2926_cov110-Isochrysis_galbana.AAC.4